MYSALWLGVTLASLYALITTGSFLLALATFAIGGGMIFTLYLIMILAFSLILHIYKDR